MLSPYQAHQAWALALYAVEEEAAQQAAADRHRNFIRVLFLLLRIQGTIHERCNLTSHALLNPSTSPWYTIYRGGTDANLMNVIGLLRVAFDDLLIVFSRH